MSAPKRISFLLNPTSGGRRGACTIAALNQYAYAHPELIEVKLIDQAKLAAQIESAKESEILVIGGGDGTISRLLPHLHGHDKPIGILPLGTGNDLARDLGFIELQRISDPVQILQKYNSAAQREVTVFCLEYGAEYSEHTLFLNYASFGFDAKVVSDFASWRKTWFAGLLRSVLMNRVGYVVISLCNFCHKLNPNTAITFRSTGQSHLVRQCSSVMFANIRSIMGMGITTRTGSAFDDQIECVVVSNPLQYCGMFLRYKLPILLPRLLGSHSTWDLDGIPDGAYVQIDGEPRADIKASNFRVRVSHKMKILVNPCLSAL